MTEADLAGLPRAAQRYLRFMGVVGRPRDWSFRARFTGRFRLRPGTGWLPAEAWQYNSAVAVGRVFVMRIRFAGVLPVTGVDSYIGGHGRMLGKLLGLIPVASGQGAEFDIGELTTYLNDALLIAPGFLLRPEVSWAGTAADRFDVSLRDAGHEVTGRLFVDERGAPFDFATTDRFAALPSGLRRAEWRTPVSQWITTADRPLPGPFRAVWNFPEGEFSYIEGSLDLASVEFNAQPAADRRAIPPVDAQGSQARVGAL